MTVHRSSAALSADSTAATDRVRLVRGLTLPATTALVVGTVIGTGVFIKTAIMSRFAW